MEAQEERINDLCNGTGKDKEELASILANGLKEYRKQQRDFYENLRSCIEKNNLPEFKKLMAKSLLLMRENNLPLSDAVKAGRVEMCKILLDAGAWADGSKESRETPLFIAAGNGNAEICKMLLSAGANPEGYFEKYGHSALVHAARNGHREICKMLLAAGANIEGNSKWEYSPLTTAIENNDTALFKFFIDAGAKVNEVFGRSSTIKKAVMAKNPEMCRILIDAGADIEGGDKQYGISPLMHAAMGGSEDICKILLDAGADVNTKSNFGDSPIFWAAKNNLPNLCKMFLDAGADVNILNNMDETPLDYARKYASPEVCKALIDAGAKSRE